jgi:hypothetical protein
MSRFLVAVFTSFFAILCILGRLLLLHSKSGSQLSPCP